MWLIYSCDGEGAEDQSTFDTEEGIITINIFILFYTWSYLFIASNKQPLILQYDQMSVVSMFNNNINKTKR